MKIHFISAIPIVLSVAAAGCSVRQGLGTRPTVDAEIDAVDAATDVGREDENARDLYLGLPSKVRWLPHGSRPRHGYASPSPLATGPFSCCFRSVLLPLRPLDMRRRVRRELLGRLRRARSRLDSAKQYVRRIVSRKPSPEPALESDALKTGLALIERTARAQTKLAFELEALAEETKAGFSKLSTAIEALAVLAAERSDAAASKPKWDEVLDAMDVLERAIEQRSAVGDGEVAAGLVGVVRRLGRFVAAAGIERIANVDQIDGALFRVIGTTREADSEHQPIRVVRAAARQNGQLLREGEILVASDSIR